MIGLWIRSVWERKGISGKLLWLVLLPFSWIYRLAVQIRNLLYTRGWLRVQALDRPVVSIGNLTVGGTGKTPGCLWLAQELAKHGLKVAILSRGYKRRESQPVILDCNGAELTTAAARAEIAAAGDEPYLMARMYGQIVAVGNDRYESGRELLQRQAVDVFILDDGFQHRRLKRNVDLLLLGRDATGAMLPCGPFREPRKAVRRADLILLTDAQEQWQSFLQARSSPSCYSGSLKATALIGFQSNQWQERPLSLLYRSRILAVSGIANPVGFYETIHEWEGEVVDTLEFPDHHDYTARDWQDITRRGHHADIILTTEKDLVKLIRFPFAKDKLLALRVAMVVENGAALVQAVLDCIAGTR
ncbi:MAG: tetraacyldisaccharide 4'-kinase [Alphaproteobacteria bacterium]